MVFKIAITGGMGSGKTRLLNYLSNFTHIKAVNLDHFGHKVLDRNALVKNSLTNYFGE